jgi:hypothetical protein
MYQLIKEQILIFQKKETKTNVGGSPTVFITKKKSSPLRNASMNRHPYLTAIACNATCIL